MNQTTRLTCSEKKGMENTEFQYFQFLVTISQNHVWFDVIRKDKRI